MLTICLSWEAAELLNCVPSALVWERLMGKKKKKIDSAPGRLHCTMVTFELSMAVDLCSYRSPGVDFLFIFLIKTTKETAVNLESLERKCLMECPLSFWKILFAAFLSSHTGFSEPKDVIRKKYFLGVWCIWQHFINNHFGTDPAKHLSENIKRMSIS